MVVLAIFILCTVRTEESIATENRKQECQFPTVLVLLVFFYSWSWISSGLMFPSIFWAKNRLAVLSINIFSFTDLGVLYLQIPVFIFEPGVSFNILSKKIDYRFYPSIFSLSQIWEYTLLAKRVSLFQNLPLNSKVV